jgi:hypothetical protein
MRCSDDADLLCGPDPASLTALTRSMYWQPAVRPSNEQEVGGLGPCKVRGPASGFVRTLSPVLPLGR